MNPLNIGLSLENAKINKSSLQTRTSLGRMRNPQSWTYASVQAPQLINRGYTGHEMLPNFGLINMNGRIYDPQIGRMLSPDNYVQETYNSQNYNRYTYCLNNPLKYTDPSGNLFKPPFLFRLLGEAADWAGNSLSGSTQPFDMNYAVSGNMSNTWQNNPNVLLGSNGYPIGPNGQSYNPYGGLGNDKHWSEYMYAGYENLNTPYYEPVYGNAYVTVGLYKSYKGKYVKYYRRKMFAVPEVAQSNGSGQVRSISAGFSFVGGYVLELGKVSDGQGDSKWFFSHGPTIGFGLGISFNDHKITSSTDEPFNTSIYEGESSQYELSFSLLGIYFGGSQPFKTKPKDGLKIIGHKYYEHGVAGSASLGPKVGGWWSETNTIIID